MDLIVNGVFLGLGYCLIAVGVALILGVAKVFDLVYASYYTIAPYVAVTFFALMGPSVSIWLTFIIAVVVTVAIALLNHNFLIIPIRHQPHSVLVSTFAVALVVQEILIFKDGSEPVHLPSLMRGVTNIMGVWVTNQKILMAGVTLLVIWLLWLFLTKTRLGLAIRATAEQPEALQLAGGNIRLVCLLAATLASVIAAIGGLLLAPIYPPSPYVWVDILLIAFAVVVLGGLGNLWSCIPASLILGISEVAFALYVPYGGIVKRTVGLLIILVVLLIKPSGLFGVKGWEEEV